MKLRRSLTLAAAVPVLFLFKEIFLPSFSSAEISSSSAFDARFTGRTMRVDLFHTGGPKGEVVALDRAIDDGPWPGSRTRLLDETNLGSHFVEVRDLRTNRAVFSRGYSSLFSEGGQTEEARRVARTFPESLRIPWPGEKVRVVLERRKLIASGAPPSALDDLFRPSADCIMFTRDPGGFCPVCRRAIGRVIDEYSRP